MILVQLKSEILLKIVELEPVLYFTCEKLSKLQFKFLHIGERCLGCDCINTSDAENSCSKIHLRNIFSCSNFNFYYYYLLNLHYLKINYYY